MNNNILSNALRKNLNWFRRSGVMPDHGAWGVAERIVQTENNQAVDQIRKSFPAWTSFEKHDIIEQRRADCTFETAYLFLLASQVTRRKSDKTIAVNLLNYLYFRSGLLNRGTKMVPPGAWNWSNIKHCGCFWLDDNAWCVFLQFAIANMEPELDARYEMKKNAILLANSLLNDFPALMENARTSEKKSTLWLGEMEFPHWGALVTMALAETFRQTKEKRFLQAAEQYLEFLEERLDQQNASELCYALLGISAVYSVRPSSYEKNLLFSTGEKLNEKMTDEGNLPAEHHEAPLGKHLADLIYTLNWAFLGFQCLAGIFPEWRERKDKMAALLVSMQDASAEPHFAGCWRGMFDLKSHSWSGGNRFEGGADSIYTGWTNAPISWGIAWELTGGNLFHPMKGKKK